MTGDRCQQKIRLETEGMLRARVGTRGTIRSLGRRDVGRRGRCGRIRAAGSSKKCGGGGDEDEFHVFDELVF